MDLDGMVGGADFVDRIAEEVAKCDVLLALIGDRWLERLDKSEGERDPNAKPDYVRLEIEAALARQLPAPMPVVPVLIENGEMPEAAELPKDMRKLSRLHAMPVRRGADQDAQLARLAKDIEKALVAGGKLPPPPPPMPPSPAPVPAAHLESSQPQEVVPPVSKYAKIAVSVAATAAFALAAVYVGGALWPKRESASESGPIVLVPPIVGAASAADAAASMPPETPGRGLLRPPIPQQSCEALTRYSPASWREAFVGDPYVGSWMVHVADGGFDPSKASEEASRLADRFPNVYFRVIATISRKNDNERYSVVIAEGLAEKEVAERIAWLANNCGIVRNRNAVPYQQSQ